MSDDEEPPPIQPVASPAARPSKAMLGMLLLNLGGTGFLAFKLLTASPVAAAAAAPVHAATTTEVMGPVVSLDPFVVNLDEPGTSRYLKCTLRLEIAPKTEEALSASKELVRDVILSYLSGLHIKDTLGAEAKDKIRQDLVAKISKLVGPDKVRRLFFADFVVQ